MHYFFWPIDHNFKLCLMNFLILPILNRKEIQYKQKKRKTGKNSPSIKSMFKKITTPGKSKGSEQEDKSAKKSKVDISPDSNSISIQSWPLQSKILKIMFLLTMARISKFCPIIIRHICLLNLTLY